MRNRCMEIYEKTVDWVSEIGRSHNITFTVRYHSVSEEVMNTHCFLELERTGDILFMPACLWVAQCA